MTPPPDQQTNARSAAESPDFGGGALRVLVAMGPTHEPIDEVRYVGNRSSGRMGLAIAAAFREAGCAVTAARGPGVAAAPGCQERRFQTAAQLLELLRAEWPAHDALIMAAAVADFRPAALRPGKLRREVGALTLELVPTQDILAGLGAQTRPDQYVVGFALERPEELEASARDKLTRKRVDAIVANPLETMDAPDVLGRVLLAGGDWIAPPERMTKEAFARWLCAALLPRMVARCRTTAG